MAKVLLSEEKKNAVVQARKSGKGVALLAKLPRGKSGTIQDCRIITERPCELVVGNSQTYSINEKNFSFKIDHYEWFVSQGGNTIYSRETEVPYITIRADKPGVFHVNVLVYVNQNEWICWNSLEQIVYANEDKRPKKKPGCYPPPVVS